MELQEVAAEVLEESGPDTSVLEVQTLNVGFATNVTLV